MLAVDVDRSSEWDALVRSAHESPVAPARARAFAAHLVDAAAYTVSVESVAFDDALRRADPSAARAHAAAIYRACDTIAANARLAAVSDTGYAARVVDALRGREPREQHTLDFYRNVRVAVGDRLHAAAEPPTLAHPRPRRAVDNDSSSPSPVIDVLESRAHDLAHIHAELGEVAHLTDAVGYFVADQARAVDALDRSTLDADARVALAGRQLAAYEHRTRAPSSVDAHVFGCIPVTRAAQIRWATFALATVSVALALRVM